ncbi:MAG: hypothetical protein AAGG56_03110 [Pseudomonadota bacterium]
MTTLEEDRRFTEAPNPGVEAMLDCKYGPHWLGTVAPANYSTDQHQCFRPGLSLFGCYPATILVLTALGARKGQKFAVNAAELLKARLTLARKSGTSWRRGSRGGILLVDNSLNSALGAFAQEGKENAA